MLDLATTLRGRPLEELLDRAERRLDFDELRRRTRRLPSLQAVLSHYAVGSTLTRSRLEEALLRLCDDHGLPRPEMNIFIEGMECDAVWRAARLIVEVDGYEFHRTRTVFVSDREKDVILELAGWTVLRFAYEHVTERAAWVAEAIRQALG